MRYHLKDYFRVGLFPKGVHKQLMLEIRQKKMVKGL